MRDRDRDRERDKGKERDAERDRGRGERYDRNVRSESYSDRGRSDASTGSKRDRDESLPAEDAAKPREKTAAELAEEEAYRAKVRR